MPPSQQEGPYPEEIKEEKQNEVEMDVMAPKGVEINSFKAGLLACLDCVLNKIMQQGSASDKIIQKDVINSLQEQILASPFTADEPIDPFIMDSFRELVDKYGLSFAKTVQTL